MLKHVSLIVLSFVVLIAVAGVSLTLRGEREMQASDEAFHEGDLATALVHARAAALSYVPGSKHVGAAYQRLSAVAIGAEAQGDLLLSRRAWETLRQVHAQTSYPGRPASALEKKIDQGLRRVDEALERTEP